MRTSFGLAAASILTAATALANNGTIQTVTVTHTSWSTMISTVPCPTPATVTLCNDQCTTLPSAIANNADIVYQTISQYQAGQVLEIGGSVTTLAQATTLTLDQTISNLVLVPDFVTDNAYTASVSITDVVYPSSMTGMSGQVVTCQTGTTTIGGDGVILTDCPCTVQSTVLELTATSIGAVPTALVPSVNYIVKIIYIYVIESIVEQAPTTITTTATSILTTIQTETATDIVTTTNVATPRPTMVTMENVTFLLEYDTSYDGVAVGNLRKRQASTLAGISFELSTCLARCAQQADCVATSLDENTSSCSPLARFNAQSRRNADGNIFAIVIFRPSASTGPSVSTSSLASTSLPRSTDRAGSSVSTDSLVSTSPGVVTRSSISMTLITTTNSDTTSIDPISESSSRISLSSALYPMTNCSLASTTSRSSERSSSSVSVAVSVSSSVITRSTSISSSEPVLVFVSSSNSNALPSTTNSSTISTTSTFSSMSSLSAFSDTTFSSAASSSGTTSINPISSSSSSTPSLSSMSSVTNSSTVSTTSASITSSSSVAPFNGCAVASDIAGYAPAMSYCSSAYPLTASTSSFDATTTEIVTTVAPATTIFSNVTLTAETRVQTNEATITETSYFSTELTVTDTTTISHPEEANNNANPEASIFSSIMARPSSDIAQVCSCLQTPMTTTITNTQTASSTTTITPIISGNYTITPPIMTLQITETNTETISVTTVIATTTSTEVVTATATPSAGAGVEQSIVTVTSSYASTYTTVQTTPTTNIETVTTCTVGTVSPVEIVKTRSIRPLAHTTASNATM
ncbi:unnamed protein product [Aureobasidium vineae]|uniref:Apple domain-containing protein n=1 Tax=Aureobasidium vineae TaxID=2773715 RepID=A0A9N8JHW3_9PEZI|nr:unnamed protein product [Aureobasidium vineae]